MACETGHVTRHGYEAPLHNFFMSNEIPHPEQLVDALSQDAQMWEDLLWCSGGALELSKTSYQIMYWDFTMNGDSILQCGQVSKNFELQSGDRMTVSVIKSKPAYSSHKTLGHYKDPAGNQT